MHLACILLVIRKKSSYFSKRSPCIEDSDLRRVSPQEGGQVARRDPETPDVKAGQRGLGGGARHHRAGTQERCWNLERSPDSVQESSLLLFSTLNLPKHEEHLRFTGEVEPEFVSQGLPLTSHLLTIFPVQPSRGLAASPQCWVL